MVEHIERDKNDLFYYKYGELFFKNPLTLLIVRSVVLGLFIYALVYGFVHPKSSENHFTTALFWSFFWPFFMFLSLPTLGAYFCSICPLAFVGKYLIKLKKTAVKMPKFLKNPYISLSIVLGVYWGLFYAFPTIFSEPIAVALFYGFFTLLAFSFYFLFKNMAYCSYICPISAIRNAFSRVSFMWLGTYENACKTCHTYECAKACEFDQSPFNFDKNNSMGDCTLCMDCANSCAAISYKAKGFGFSLLDLSKKAKAVDVWTYILLFAFMTLTMKLRMLLNIFGLSGYLPSSPLDIEALLILLVSVTVTLYIVNLSFTKTADYLHEDKKELFVTFGYAYAPLALISSFGVAAQSFFTRYFHSVINGFIEAFHLPFHFIEPLADVNAAWLEIFNIFDFIAIFWTGYILFKRLKAANVYSIKVMFYLSLLPLFYLLLCFADFRRIV